MKDERREMKNLALLSFFRNFAKNLKE